MMKRIFAALTLILCISMPFAVFADFQNPSVSDGAGFLTEEEVMLLTETLDNIRSAYEFDVSVVTESVMSGSDAESTADDIFDYKGYGAGEGKDGIMFYVSEEPRKYQLSTHGSGIDCFTDSKLISIEDAFLPYLKDNDYYNAFNEFALKCDEILYEFHNYVPGDGDSYGYGSDGYESYGAIDDAGAIPPLAIAIVILLPLLIAFIATQIKLAKMNTAVSNKYAADYMRPGSMNLTDSSDIFLYSTVSQTLKPQPEDHDSSSVHTSSSGESHGGRGGSY